MRRADDLLKSVASFHTTEICQIGHWVGFISKENGRPSFTVGKIVCIKCSKGTLFFIPPLEVVSGLMVKNQGNEFLVFNVSERLWERYSLTMSIP